jgi:hypothetical protein
MFYELVRALLPHISGLTDEAVKELENAIQQHQAEHTALVSDLQARTGAATTEGVTP